MKKAAVLLFISSIAITTGSPAVVEIKGSGSGTTPWMTTALHCRSILRLLADDNYLDDDQDS
jgi:hypothetical protein